MGVSGQWIIGVSARNRNRGLLYSDKRTCHSSITGRKLPKKLGCAYPNKDTEAKVEARGAARDGSWSGGGVKMQVHEGRDRTETETGTMDSET